MRHVRHLGLGLLLSLAGSAYGLPAAAADRAPGDIGEWSAPVDVGVIGIHAALLPTGKFILWSYPSGAGGSAAFVIDPATSAATDVTLTAPRDVFCSGHSQLPDGRLLVTGGQIFGDPVIKGTREVSTFDFRTNKWKRLPQMARGRWYPTNTAMPDGTTLVATGLDEDGVTVVDAMESYNPATNTWTTLPASANMYSDLYAQMSLLPSGKVFRSEPNQDGELFDPQTNTWSYVDDLNYGWRTYAGSVLLPGLEKVLVSGGYGSSATATAEVIDMSSATPQWEYTGSMHTARWMHNLTLLPDGTVLAVAGGQGPGLYDAPVFSSELFDPATGQWTVMASQAVQRTYHGTTLLLPDGRVVSAGSDFGPQRTTIEYYSPPYLFKGPRPTVTFAPSSLRYGQTFTIATPDAASISKVALIKLGSTTHTNDFEQRYVDLQFLQQSGQLKVRAPAQPVLAPRGYYMLFIVNSDGVPAVAPILRVK
jgi:hypothetical protein